MTSKLSNSRRSKAPPAKPLFGRTDYPITSAVDALVTLSKSIKVYPFRFVVWTDDKKGFQKYYEGGSAIEVEFGYSTKEQHFLNECTERGDRWRHEVVSDHAAISEYLQKEASHAVVITGEDLTSLAARAIYYFDRIPVGPKTVILGFHSRLLEPSHLYRLWSFLKGQNRLHLLKNLAYLNSSRSNRKFLPVIYDKQKVDDDTPIWDVVLEDVTPERIHQLFFKSTEEGERIDYKETGCLSSKSDARELLKDFAAMANANGGMVIIGIRESNGRPLQPTRAGLQSVRNVDQQINRLYQLISTHFKEATPKVEMRSLEVFKKSLLLVKVFRGVEPVGGKKNLAGDVEYPERSGRITVWRGTRRKAG